VSKVVVRIVGGIRGGGGRKRVLYSLGAYGGVFTTSAEGRGFPFMEGSLKEKEWRPTGGSIAE